MSATGKTVLPKKPLGKEDVSAALSEAWFRISKKVGKGRLADATGAKCTKTIDNAINGNSLPELHTALNSLVADPTALDEVLGLYGGSFVPFKSQAANDLETIAAMSHVAGDWLNRLMDGVRCHRDTRAIAVALRPLLTELQAIVREAEAA